MAHRSGRESGLPLSSVTGDAHENVRSPTTKSRAAWLVVLLPWAWFLVRSLHPILEYVAIGLPLIIAVTAVVAIGVSLLRRSTLALTFALSMLVFFAVTVIAPMRPTSAAVPTSSVRVATMNLGLYWFSDNDAGFFVFQEEPDILVGVELAESHDAEFRERFEFAESEIIPLLEQQQNESGLTPVGETFRQNGLPSIGVYSNVPIAVLEDPLQDVFPGGLPGFRLQVEAAEGPFILYALHIPRPFPGEGAYQLPASDHVELVEAIAVAIEAEELPVLLAGDLNTVDRGQSYRRLTNDLNDGMRQSGWAVPTAARSVVRAFFFARLDHLLVTDELCVSGGASFDTRYADHRPLIGDVGRCAN